MNYVEGERRIVKEHVVERLSQQKVSYIEKYQTFFVGNHGLSYFVKFELICSLLGPMPGGVGLLFRKWFYPTLFKSIGSGVLWGRNISLRHPGMIEIGDRVAIDDNCLLDAKGRDHGGIQIGNDVLIARGTIIQAHASWIKIGERCIIGAQCQLASQGGISLGNSVGIAGQCYIGGGRYPLDDINIPIKDQLPYSKGPVIIEDEVAIGAGVIVQDGVRIGKGSMIGAGAIVREDLPEYTVVTPYQRFILFPRGQAEGNPLRS